MAHKKAAGSAKNLRDSNPKYRGLKLAGGQMARAWNIIVRQKGDKYRTWLGVYKGKDFTIHARIDGIVSFRKKRFKRFDGRTYERTVVEIVSPEEYALRASSDQNSKSTTIDSKKKTPKKVVKAKKVTTPAKKEVAQKKEVTVSTGEKDDLTKIEGIGPKIQEIFYAAGILMYADLSGSKVWDLRQHLKDAGPRFASHDPSTWKKQATMAKNGKRDELKARQDELDGGKVVA